MSSRSTIIALLSGLAATGCQQEPAEPARETYTPASQVVSQVTQSTVAEPPFSAIMTCDYPVSSTDDTEALVQRYGAAARRETVDGPEGTTFEALVLWPDDPGRRVELLYQESGAIGAEFGTLRIRSPHSAWRVADVGIGTSVEKVERANGRPFTIAGFGWDYGGYADLAEGQLTRLSSGCGLSLRFDPEPGAPLPSELQGDGVRLASSEARLRAAAPNVSEITVHFSR